MPVSQAPPRRSPRQSLATKIIFFVFVSTFVTALVVTGISVHSTYAFLRRDIDRSFPAALERTSERLTNWLTDGRLRVEEIARNERLRSWLLARLNEDPLGEVSAGLDPILQEELSHARTFSSLVVLDAAGRVRGAIGTDAAPSEGLPPELAGSASATLRAVSLGGGPIPVASAPLLDGGGRKLGSVHGIFRRDGLATQLRSDLLGNTGNVTVVDTQGLVLTASRQQGEDRVPLQDLLGNDRPEVREFVAADGRRAIGIAKPLDPFGWNLVIHQPFDRAFEPVYSVVGRILLIDLVIVLAFSFAAWKVTAAVVHPITALYEGARRISQGELEVELPDTRSQDEVGLLTRTFNDMIQRLRKDRHEIESAYERLQEQSDELQRANEVLEQLSITDGLTRLHNHRYFQEHLTREIKRVSRTNEPLSMLVIDIDDFKRLNDRLGHAAGDELLVRIARTLNESVRASDLLARYGGEEFVVLAPGTETEGAVNLAEKIRTAVAESSFILDDSMRLTRVTVSIGVARYAGSRRDFFEAADKSLYRAKAAGKNCVMAAEEAA